MKQLSLKDPKKDGFDKDFEIASNKNLSIQNDKLSLIVQNTGTGNDILITYSLIKKSALLKQLYPVLPPIKYSILIIKFQC